MVAQANREGAESLEQGGVAIQRVRGGGNNAMYRMRLEGIDYACKLCVVDERQRAQREYAALRLLDHAGLDIAPEPILIDESSAALPFPIVVYRWVNGQPLACPLNELQMSAILESIQAFHSRSRENCKDAGIRDAWFHWFSFDPYLDELSGFLLEYGGWLADTDEDGKSLFARLTRLLESCVETVSRSRVNPGRDKIELRFAHVDPNLANAIWDGEERLRWVDWEYSGWGDPAMELADLRWHIALEDVTREQHAWFRAHYQAPKDDDKFEERLGMWDHILATRWAFLMARALWVAKNGPERPRLTYRMKTLKRFALGYYE
jgi:aminoglycoside phosphotransferase (APT) family kinase protein